MIRIGDTWGSIRGIIRNMFSFAEIKDLVGASGLPIHRLSHLQQKFSGGASKGQLMDAIDGLVANLDDDSRDRFVEGCLIEAVKSWPKCIEQLDHVLHRVGWGISDAGPYPLRLQIDLETAHLSEPIHDGVANCLRRYRQGDMAGAISAICGVVDSLTEDIYKKYGLGNHRDDSYQQRISRSFAALEASFRKPLATTNLAPKEANRIWQNHKGAVNQAGYVLGAFRREYSDAHGVQNSPPEMVQRAIDCAVFIVRSITNLL